MGLPPKYRYLFNGVVFELLDGDGDRDTQIERLVKKRNSAIKEILDRGGLMSCINFAKKVASPFDVGRALGEIEYDLIENELLPTFLDSNDEVEKQVLSANDEFMRVQNGEKNSQICGENLQNELKFCGDKNVLINGNIFTSKGPATAMEFALILVREICGERKYSEIKSDLLF